MSTIRKRIVDKGTIYQREVCTDLDTIAGRQEELEAIIATFIQGRAALATGRGKTERHRKHGIDGRRRERRAAHEGWMHKAATDPTRVHAHPFYVTSGK